jgi:dinuclear metal center YbgI/SA1388 family protein
MHLRDLEAYCDELLRADGFEDYCPNGLQVEAGTTVRRLVTGVTACQALIEAAVADGADVLLVHHGYFWKGETPALTGIKGRRVRTLIAGEVSLLAYHLPLDAHPVVGNNRQLAERLGFVDAKPLDDELLWCGRLPKPLSPEELGTQIAARLGREPLHVGEGPNRIERIAWCTGAAQGFITRAAECGVDAFVTGEVSEATVHTARELGLHFYAAGHHATERYGVQALGDELARTFDLAHRFIDIDNPV